AWSVEPSGTIRLGEIKLTGPIETIAIEDVERLETYRPVGTLKLGYRKNHRTHSAAEISAAILTSEIDDAGNLAVLDFVQLGAGGQVVRENGSTPVTDATAITNLGTAAAITGQGPFATDARDPAALFVPNANMIYNGGLRLRLDGWTGSGWVWSAGGGEGGYAYAYGTGTLVQTSRPMGAYAGETYTLSGETLSNLTGGLLRADVQWFKNAAGTIPTDTGSNGGSFQASGVTDWTRRFAAMVAPAGTVAARVRFFTEGVTTNGGPQAFRRLKLSRGSLQSPFSDEATDSALYASGSTIDSLMPAEIGSNVTELRTAAAFTGQTSWATYSGLTPGNVAGQVQYLDTAGNLSGIQRITDRRLNLLRRADGVTDLTEAAAITSLGTAAAITGQGAFATVSSAAYGSGLLTGFGSLAARNRARLGLEIYRADDSTLINDSDAITSLGTAAAIAGQGSLATRSRARFGLHVYRADDATLINDADAVTSLGTAAAFAGQGALATQNFALASRIPSGEISNIIPDSGYYDLAFWGNLGGVGSLADFDSGWASPRGIAITPSADFDFYSSFFDLEVGATYRIETRVWNNGAGGWTGGFQPLVHHPSVAWYSPLTGGSVSPGTHNVANGSVIANGDTGRVIKYFRCTAEVMRRIQFRFISTARGSNIQVYFQITKVAQLGKDILRNASAVPYSVAELETSLGTAASFTGQGAWATDARSPESVFNPPANLIPNGGFRLGLSRFSGGIFAWSAGGNEGPYVYTAYAGVTVASSDPIPVYGGGTYCLQCEIYGSTIGAGGYTATDIEYFSDAAGTVSVGYSTPVVGYQNDGWPLRSISSVAPGSAVSARIRLYTGNNSGAGISAWRRLKVARGAVATPFSDEATDGANMGKVIGKVVDPLIYNTQSILGIGGTTNLTPTYTVGGSNVTVNLPSHTRKVAGPSGPVTLTYGAGSGVVAFSTYWIAYIDDPQLTGFASPTIGFTASLDALLYPGRYPIASGTTPSAAGTGGGTGAPGGGGFPPECVSVSAFVAARGDLGNEEWKLSPLIRPGRDFVRVMLEDRTAGWALCTGNYVALAPGVRLILKNGRAIECSTSTPVTQPDFSTVLAEASRGALAAFNKGDGIGWSVIAEVIDIGEIEVSHLSCDGGTYLASMIPGEGVFTHNIAAKP
ncbi:MAG: hypothetical protein H0U52_15210, partial [Chloroflexi bacterium]|nr:hypothetical protein [Chloroflexota bacterium]